MNMEYQVLARKWRPQQFDEVIGQGHVTTTLKNAIAMDRVAHAYLFTGPRGIGKTSLARILAKAINCAKGPGPSPCDRCPSCKGIMAGNSMDVLEIDGASNRGIDQIRELRENVKFAPSSSRYKVYIIDEVHQITSDAFNALLKTLEEPPPHVKFFFATTEPHRVPGTILSRCQRFDLRSISPAEIVERLSVIAKAEKIKIDQGACYAIGRYAHGSMRDAVSILDQLVSFSDGAIDEEKVIAMLGLVRESVLRDMSEALLGGDCRRGLELIAAVAAEGKDLPLFLADWISYLRGIMLVLVRGEREGIEDVSPEAGKAIVEQSKKTSMDRMLYVLDLLARAEQQMQRAQSPRILFELAFMKAATTRDMTPLAEILKRLAEMEKRIAVGGRVAGPHRDTPGPGAGPAPGGVGSRGAGEAAGGKPPAGRAAPPLKDATQAMRRDDPDPSAGAAVLARVQEVWHEVLDRVARVRPVLKSYLVNGIPASCEDGVLTVEFGKEHSYHRDTVDDPRDKQLVRSALCDSIGADINVKFEVKTGTPEKEKAEPPPAPAEEIQSIKKNPLIQSALEMFQAQVVDVRR